MRRIVAPKLCSRKNNSCVRTNKQWPSTRPNFAPCGKRLRDCGRAAWLGTPPTRRHRSPTARCSKLTAMSHRPGCAVRVHMLRMQIEDLVDESIEIADDSSNDWIDERDLMVRSTACSSLTVFADPSCG